MTVYAGDKDLDEPLVRVTGMPHEEFCVTGDARRQWGRRPQTRALFGVPRHRRGLLLLCLGAADHVDEAVVSSGTVHMPKHARTDAADHGGPETPRSVLLAAKESLWFFK